jgi:hypothetical protein
MTKRDPVDFASMASKQPDDLAKYLGHALVGAGFAWGAYKLFKGALPASVALVLSIAVHYELDAPVSKTLRQFGVS